MTTSTPHFGKRQPGVAYRPRPSSYALIRDDAGRVAVVETPKGCWLPGGGREGDESAEATLAREVREECGFDVRILGQLGSAREYVHAEGEGDFKVEGTFFVAEALEPAGGEAGAPDHRLRWMEPAHAVQRLRPRSHAWAVARFGFPLPVGDAASGRNEVVVRDLEPADVPSCEAVLRALPSWFGMEAPIVDYVDSLGRLSTHVAVLSSEVVGFAAVDRPLPSSAELHVIAVRPELHDRGVGHALLARIEAGLAAEGVRLLQVKTLGPSHPDPDYARTRRTYERWGFVPLDESTREWGPENPCLRLVKWMGGDATWTRTAPFVTT